MVKHGIDKFIVNEDTKASVVNLVPDIIAEIVKVLPGGGLIAEALKNRLKQALAAPSPGV